MELNIDQPQQKINLIITIIIKMRLNLTNSYKENKKLKRLKRVSVFFWNNLPNIQLFLLQFIRKQFFIGSKSILTIIQALKGLKINLPLELGKYRQS
jgi:hypothetical protein